MTVPPPKVAAETRMLRAAEAQGRHGAGSMTAKPVICRGLRGRADERSSRATGRERLSGIRCSGHPWCGGGRRQDEGLRSTFWSQKTSRTAHRRERPFGNSGASCAVPIATSSCSLVSLNSIPSAILDAIAIIASGKKGSPRKLRSPDFASAPRDLADWTNHLRVIDAVRDKRPAVWHIHGDLRSTEFDHLSRKTTRPDRHVGLPQFARKSAGLDFMLVFVGCSGSGLSDDNVGRLLNGCTRASPARRQTCRSRRGHRSQPSPTGARCPLRRLCRSFGPSRRLAPLVMPSRLPPDPRMIGREDRLEELVRAILDYDRPIVVPGALGMGKTTLALAAAHDPRIIERFGKERRFFVNLEPAPDAEGVLSRLATQLGLPATGAAHELESEDRRRLRSRADAGDPRQSGDALAQRHRRDRGASRPARGDRGPSAGHHGSRRTADIGARTLRDVERLQDADARACSCATPAIISAADPALPGLLKALDGHPLSIELPCRQCAGQS